MKLGVPLKARLQYTTSIQERVFLHMWSIFARGVKWVDNQVNLINHIRVQLMIGSSNSGAYSPKGELCAQAQETEIHRFAWGFFGKGSR